MWITGLIVLSIVNSIYCQADVRLPPTIIQNPIKTYNYRSDEAVTLYCKAYGIPAVDYEWKKNGGDLNLNLYNIRRIAEGSIEIKPMTSMDEGYYQCLAKNQYGTAMSNTSFQQMAVHSPSQQTNVVRVTVNEGDPFVIQMQPVKSIPPAQYEWESALDSVDKSPVPIVLSKRMQIADNGDLYFAYAVGADDLSGRIYKSTAFNEYLDLRSGGSYTQVVVTRVPGGPPKFAPTFGFPQPGLTIAVEGKDVTLRCFFSGNPEPNIQWSGPKNLLPIDRIQYDNVNSKLKIINIQQSDQGDYVCTGTNEMGTNKYTQQLKVEAKPTFLSFNDRPHDTNITEDSSISFNCRAHAIPEATVTWYRNSKPIDVNVPPKRYSFSTDRKTLTIQNLCRNCADRPDSSQSDLGIIQCNASNVHGYDFGAGYVNVLTKTGVTIIADETTVGVDMNEEKRVEFECKATSDPLTPVAPMWYRKDSSGVSMVYDAPPIVSLNGGLLIIHVVPNNTEEWVKHRGIYNCTASNNYSSASALAEIKINDDVTPVAAAAGIETYWWIILLILLILLLLIIICCCCCCMRRNRGDKYDVDDKERKNGNDPEKELKTNDFQDYQRPEAQTLRGSRGSLGSVKLNSDDEASLLEYGDDPGKFTEDGSFVGAYASNTAERGRGRKE